jgi:hypothetical protein
MINDDKPIINKPVTIILDVFWSGKKMMEKCHVFF